jgi:hypothetical protein
MLWLFPVGWGFAIINSNQRNMVLIFTNVSSLGELLDQEGTRGATAEIC